MLWKRTYLISCTLLTVICCCVLAPREVIPGYESESTKKLSLDGPGSAFAAEFVWTSMLKRNFELLEEDVAKCIASCDRTMKAADAEKKTAVVAIALLQRSCARMDQFGVEFGYDDFEEAMEMFPETAGDEYRLLFVQALCIRERNTSQQDVPAIDTPLMLELANRTSGVNPNVRLRACCDLLSYQKLDGTSQRDFLRSARQLLLEAPNPVLGTRLEFLARRQEFLSGAMDGDIRLMTMVDELNQQGGLEKLPRLLKIEMLIVGAQLHSGRGDVHTAFHYLKKAESEAVLLQNKTLVASCLVELAGLNLSDTEAQTALHQWQAFAVQPLIAINDAGVLIRWSRAMRRCDANFRDGTARKISERLDVLKTNARLSESQINLWRANRDRFKLARQAEQLTEEKSRADAEGRWSLLVLRTGIAVSACLILILLRERWQLNRANAHLKTEMIRNEEQQLEKERMELRLAKTERLESLGALAGGIAHDFNNLLVGVIGNADLLTHIEPGSPMAKNCVDGIIRSAETASDLSRKMLAYAGKEVARKRVIDLNELVDRMLPLLRSGLAGRHSVRFLPAAECLATEADSGQLEQVLLNLVSNASQAIEGNDGRITIRTGIVTHEEIPVDIPVFGNRKVGGTFVWFEVDDNGAGIPESNLSRIFEPFYSTKQQSTGHGFGLAVVYGHVNRHNGLIQLQSRPGKGTCLRILLPWSSELVLPEQTPVAGSPGSAVSEFVSVVAIDDQVEVLNVIKRTFAASGATAYTFLSAKEALEFLSGNDNIDCILLDMMMPVVDGSVVLEELMHAGNQIPIVVMSGYAATDLGQFLRTPGVRAVVQKPFRPGELLASVRSVISAAGSSSQSEFGELQDIHPRL